MTATDPTKTNSSTRHVIEAMMLIAQSAHPLGLNEIAEAMGLPQSTAHRALMTLEESGFAKRVGHTSKLVAGEVVHHLIRSMVELFPARGLLSTAMRDLSHDLDVTVSLNWRVGWHSLRLSSFEGSRESYQIRRVGEARPLHSGIGPVTILGGLGPGEIDTYCVWWEETESPANIEPPAERDLKEMARAIAQEGKVRREPSEYSALVWMSYPLRASHGKVQGSLSVGMAPSQSEDSDFERSLDLRVATIAAELMAAGNAAASRFDTLAPDEVQLDQLKVLRLISDAA